MTLSQNVLSALWFFLPAGIANMMPVLAAHFPMFRDWTAPIDFGLTFRGKRVFGTNKTIRGFVVGVLFGTLTVLAQKELYLNSEVLRSALSVDYSVINPLILGLLLSAGALLGDAGESFVKRQLDIASGEAFLLFDQTDYILGGILFTFWYVPLSGSQYGSLIVIWIVMHFAVAALGYLLGLKEKPI